MLKLTKAAGIHLAEILDKRDAEDDEAVRIVRRNSRFALSFGRRKDGDAALEYKGRTVLLVAADAVEHLDGETVHVRETGSGKKLCHGGKGLRKRPA